MQKMLINGGRPLQGEVKISGAKNSALPLLFSTILSSGTHVFCNVPNLADIRTTCELLKVLGSDVEQKEDQVKITNKMLDCHEAPYELVKTMRASVLCLGPLLSRYGQARVSLPGGCSIGARPIDQHLKGLEKMGANIELNHGYVEARAKRLHGASIVLDLPTVTGTENLLMAATLARGITEIKNAACEPEIVQLVDTLNIAGAKIDGAGTQVLTVEGVNDLCPLQGVVIADRIEAGTMMIASAITHGQVWLRGVKLDHMAAVTSKLDQAGVKLVEEQGRVQVKADGCLCAIDVDTQPYPGFPTDMQAQFMALMCVARGSSVIKEHIFENRFMHVPELRRMGARISIDGHVVLVRGVDALAGAPVMATDLRASASLVLAALAAKGRTEISRIYHLDRGYQRLDQKLRKLGAQIRRTRVHHG